MAEADIEPWVLWFRKTCDTLYRRQQKAIARIENRVG